MSEILTPVSCSVQDMLSAEWLSDDFFAVVAATGLLEIIGAKWPVVNLDAGGGDGRVFLAAEVEDNLLLLWLSAGEGVAALRVGGIEPVCAEKESPENTSHHDTHNTTLLHLCSLRQPDLTLASLTSCLLHH